MTEKRKNHKLKIVNSPTLLGVKISTANQTEVFETLISFLKGKSFNHVATVNPEFLVEAHKNDRFKKLLNYTDLNVCDGFGITFWTKILYKKNIPRMTGVFLAENLCRIAAENQKSVYFIGGFGVAQTAAEKMKSTFPDLIIAGAEDGSPKEIPQTLVQTKPDIILVAFGAPAQEFWIDKFKLQLTNTKIAVGIGGTFDFWTGKATRAPKIMQKLGLEWFWRLITQPKRAKRIYNAVVVFSALVLKERFIK